MPKINQDYNKLLEEGLTEKISLWEYAKTKPWSDYSLKKFFDSAKNAKFTALGYAAKEAIICPAHLGPGMWGLGTVTSFTEPFRNSLENLLESAYMNVPNMTEPVAHTLSHGSIEATSISAVAALAWWESKGIRQKIHDDRTRLRPEITLENPTEYLNPISEKYEYTTI